MGAWNAAVPPACLCAAITCCALAFMKPLSKRLARWLIQQIQELEQEHPHGRHGTSCMSPSAALGCNGMAKSIPSPSHRPQGQPASVSKAPTNADGCLKQDAYNPCPRTEYLEWDDYFMALAFLSAQRSKDPSKQVGAVIVGANKVILGIGYNGFPRGCSDKSLPWSKKAWSEDPLDTKYPYVVHAEANALLNKNAASVEGATVYVTMFPCNECAKLLIQAGIREVVFNESKVQPDCGGLTQGCSQHSLTNGTQAAAAPPHRSAVAAGSAGARSAQERRHEAGSAGTSGHKKQAATACYAAGGMEEGAQQGGESGDCGSCGGDSNSACGCSSQDGARKCQQAEGSQNPLPCAHNGAHGAIPCAGTQGAECAAGGESICASSGGGSDMNVVVGVSEHGQGGGKGVKREARGMEKSAMEASYRASLKLLTLAGVQLRQHCLARTVVLSGVDSSA